MKFWRSAMPALLAGFISLAVLAGPRAAAAQQVQALNPSRNDMQTQGKVGKTNYLWTNGRAWLSLNDDAKVAMVAGIEQGIILSVRENWDSLPQKTQPELVSTATRLTIGGVSFDQLVLEITNFYLIPGDIEVPVVDAYLYALMKLKKSPEDKLKDMVNRLRKTYPAPVAPKPQEKH